MQRSKSRKCYWTIWNSVSHIGTRSSQAETALAVPKETENEALYLAGDIHDCRRVTVANPQHDLTPCD